MPRPSADTSVFYAIADPHRRAVLDLLRERAMAGGRSRDHRSAGVSASKPGVRPALLPGEMTVASLQESFPFTQSAMSQHLAVLRRAGLVTQRKAGRHRMYRVNPAPLRELADWIEPFEAFWESRLDNLGRYLDRARASKEQRS